jgi:hypothetical protein
MTRRRFTLLAVAAVAFLKFVILGQFVVPPWSNADETAHYSYVMLLARGDFTPEHGVDRQDPAAFASQNGTGRPGVLYVLSHPPLYYLAMAPFGAVADAVSDDPVVVLKTLRLVTSFVSTIGVVLIVMTAMTLGLSWAAVWLVAGITLATPHFGSLSGGVSNDIGVFTTAAMGAYFLARFLKQGARKDEALAIVGFAGAALCKATSLPFFVAFSLFFLLLRLWKRDVRQIVLTAATVAAAGLPIFLWHLDSFIRYGNWVRLGSLKTVKVLSTTELPLLDFLASAKLTDHFLASFHGHTWLRRLSDQIVMIYVPSGGERTAYISLIAAMLVVVVLCMIVRRGAIGEHWLERVGAVGIALVAAYLSGSFVAGQPITEVVIAAMTFMGVYAIARSYRLLISDDASEKFTILAFAAMFCMAVLMLYQIWQVTLIWGKPRAMHGRYFYAVAPMFLVAIAAAIDLKPIRRWVFPALLVGFFLLESYYWNHSAWPIYRAYWDIRGL